MRSPFALIDTLVVPAGGMPSIQLLDAASIPAILQTHYAGAVVAAELWMITANDYVYAVVLNSAPARVDFGRVIGNLTVSESLRFTLANVAGGIEMENNWTFKNGGLYNIDGTTLLTATMQVGGSALGVGSVSIEPGQTGPPLVPAGSLAIGTASFSAGDTIPSWTAEGVEVGRGLRSYIDSTGNTAPVGAEAVILTAAAAQYYNGRAYRFSMGTDSTNSAAGTGTYRIRRTNLAGAVILGAFNFTRVAGALSGWSEFSSVGVATADVNQAHVLTAQASAGTVTGNGAASRPRWFKVEDCGAASDYPNAPAI